MTTTSLKRAFSRFENRFDRFLRVFENFGLARFQRQNDVGRAGLDPQLEKTPDAVAQLERVVEHVDAFDVPFRDIKNIRAFQFGGDFVAAEIADAADRRRGLVLRRNVFPGRQKHLPVHFAVVREKRFERNRRREIKHFQVVFDRHLQRVQRLHLLHSARRRQNQLRRHCRAGRHCRKRQRTRRRETERILVELNPEIGHRLHSAVRHVHFHDDLNFVKICSS
jgi:hypothetical protein